MADDDQTEQPGGGERGRGGAVERLDLGTGEHARLARRCPARGMEGEQRVEGVRQIGGTSERDGDAA